MSDPWFTDRRKAPTEETVLEAIGRAGPAWRALFEQIREEYPELSEVWNYYADGGSWLLKVLRGSKTVFWVSVVKNGFRVGFYFPERFTPALLESELSQALKRELRQGNPSGKLRRVSIEFGSSRAIRDVMTLIALKKAQK
jgi:uncharacterized protein DUF3788